MFKNKLTISIFLLLLTTFYACDSSGNVSVGGESLENGIFKNSLNEEISTNTTAVNSIVSTDSHSEYKDVEIIISSESKGIYKIGEQFAGVNLPVTAVGETSNISGSIFFTNQGKVMPGSSIVVDVTTLKSDENKRDGWVKRSGGIGDNVIFDVTNITNLTWPLPKSGSLNVIIDGNLTISNITANKNWSANLNFENEKINGVASTTITWEEFSLVKPRFPFILSLDDEIILEIHFNVIR